MSEVSAAHGNDEPLRVAVVGVGHLGQHHARILHELAQAELIAVVDTDESRARDIAAKTSCTPLTSHTQLPADLDAVTIAVPTTDHFEVASYFLEREVAILVEKPLTSTLDEADRLLQLRSSSGSVLQVGHLERFNPSVVAMSDYLDVPLYIETQRIGAFSGRGTDVDVVMDLMIHDLDIVLSLLDAPCRRVDAVGVPVLSDQVDIATATLHFESGCVATLTASRVSTKKLRKMRIFQRSSYLSLDFEHQNLEVCRLADDAIEHRDNISSVVDEDSPSLLRESVPVSTAEPLAEELKSFIEAVRTDRRPVVTGEMGREAMAVACQVRSVIDDSVAEMLEANRAWMART